MAQDALATDPLLGSVPAREGYKVLGGVVLYEKLGQGGMGAVYRGRHLRLALDVALKVMAPPAGMSPSQGESFVRRFIREARTAASVKHQNLVRVYDVNAEGGLYYLIMDYVDGESAGDRLKRRTAARGTALSEQEAVEICLGAAEGLGGAHEQGVVHRDVKPDNILIDKKGNVVVADLGLAKAFSSGESDDAATMGLSMTQQAMGTPFYMSPEQTRSAKDVGPEADVWSLGVTLYQLVTNHLPWPDTDISDLFQKIRGAPLPDLKDLCADVSADLGSITDKSLRKNPGERYRDCREFAEALRGHLDSSRASRGASSGSALADPEAGSTKLSLIKAPRPATQTMSLIADVALLPPPAPTAPTAPMAVSPSDLVTIAEARRPGRRGARFALVGLVALVALGAGAAAWRFLGGPSTPSVIVESTPGVNIESARNVTVEAGAARSGPMSTRESEETVASLLATARALRETGLREKACDKLVEALSVVPDHEEVKQELRDIQAEAERKRVEAQRAAEYRKWTDKGLELRMSGDLEAAAEAYGQAAERAAEGSTEAAACLHEILKLQGTGAAKRGDLESAVELYTKALGQRDEPGLRVELAKVSAMLEAKTKERALQAKVDDLLERAREARAKGDLDKALDLYRQAAKDGADVQEDVVPLERELARRTAYERGMKRARELVGQNEWKGAASVLNEVLQSRPADAEAARLLAEVEGHLGPRRLIAVDLGGGVSLPLIYIPPGRFVMGSNEDDDEKPAHEVVITRGFYMGKYELTQAQCQRVMGMNPSKWKDPARPVERVSWNDSVVLCRKLSEATGRRFRLPTEAEWEYACRAGSTGQYSFGDDASGPRRPDNVVDPTGLSRYAHYSASSGGQTQRVGGKLPNAWGLHDMHGNVWEWCRDRYSKNYYASSPTEDPEGPASGHQRVLRGGSWYVDAKRCRSPNRGSGLATSRTTSAGLRVVCDP